MKLNTGHLFGFVLLEINMEINMENAILLLIMIKYNIV